MRLIVLAAGQGIRLRPITDDRPKCMVELAGRTLLERQIDTARALGITDIVVVAGYRADRLRHLPVRVVMNDRFETTNMVRSLFCAEEWFDDGFLLAYGDIVYAPWVLRTLTDSPAAIGVTVDRAWGPYWEMRFDDVLADAESLRIDAAGHIRSIGQRETDIERIEAQYMGLLGFRGAGVAALRETYAAAVEDDQAGRMPLGGPRTLDRMFMTDLLQALVDRGHAVTAVPVEGGWLEIDSVRDLEVAEGLAEARLGLVTGAHAESSSLRE